VISEAFISSVFHDTFKSIFVYYENITDMSLLELIFIFDVGIYYKEFNTRLFAWTLPHNSLSSHLMVKQTKTVVAK